MNSLHVFYAMYILYNLAPSNFLLVHKNTQSDNESFEKYDRALTFIYSILFLDA